MNRTVITVLAVSLFVAAGAFAQPMQGGMGGRMGGGMQGGMGGGLEMACVRVIEKLDLTEEQKEELRKIREDAREEVKDLMEDVKEKQSELRELLQEEEISKKAVLKKAEEISKLRGKAHLTLMEALVDAIEELTPEQRKEAKRLIEERKERLQQGQGQAAGRFGRQGDSRKGPWYPRERTRRTGERGFHKKCRGQK